MVTQIDDQIGLSKFTEFATRRISQSAIPFKVSEVFLGVFSATRGMVNIDP
jgi:hypothetical protein